MRIRTIKPEFWENEKLSALPEATHMLAAALLNYADDEGYFNANPKLIGNKLMPLREPSVSIHESLKLLQNIDYLRLASSPDGRVYGWIVGFTDNQTISRASPSKIKKLSLDFSDSSNAHELLSEDSTAEQGTGNREQGNTTAAARPAAKKAAAKKSAPKKSEAEGGNFEAFKQAYPKRGGSQPWPRALKAIFARLREGHTWQEILEGVERYRAFCEATGKVGTETVMQAATFCGPDKRFLETFEIPAQVRKSQHLQTAGNDAFDGGL